ncbi:MAG: hypothetical protein NT001_01840 [Candidatus Woesearchaeota archaeon]|nr:hypothetical protein [Candidatus Woesearchaeota archaeon]
MSRNKLIPILLTVMIILPLLFLLSSAEVHALGVSPARTDVDFKPDQTKDYTINIINNERKDMKLMVFVDGDLSGLVKIDKKMITVSKNEYTKAFTFKLKNPHKFEKAGVNEIPIRILELPEGSGSEEDAAKVGSTVEVVHQVMINVPYPGVYAEVTDVYVMTSPDNKYVQFTMPVFNKGSAKLDSIKGIIEIYDLEGKLVGSVETNSLSLESNAEGKITAQFLTQDRRGRYHAKINVMYAGKEIKIEKDFFIGTEMIEVQGASVDKFTLGGIAKFNIFLNSKWNQLIKDIYAEVEIKDSKNKQLTKFKTASIDMDPNSVGMLNAYWDTANVNPGTYTMHVILYYTRIATDKLFTLDVGFNSIKIRESATGAVIAGGDNIDTAKSPLLVIAVVALIIINIVILILFYRAKKGKGKGGSDASNDMNNANTINTSQDMNTSNKPKDGSLDTL